MPIFEFQCADCKAITEVVLSIKDREKKTFLCPKCSTKMEPVLISKPAPFQWGKSGGWQ